jgi:hypothetical protein
MSEIKRLIATILGGRPMYFDGQAFTDTVSGFSVNYFTDRFGRRWLANHRWSIFRVPRN